MVTVDTRKGRLHRYGRRVSISNVGEYVLYVFVCFLLLASLLARYGEHRHMDVGSVVFLDHTDVTSSVIKPTVAPKAAPPGSEEEKEKKGHDDSSVIKPTAAPKATTTGSKEIEEKKSHADNSSNNNPADNTNKNKYERNTTNNDDDDDDKTRFCPNKVAIMISGQFGRFVMKDNKGPLITQLDRNYPSRVKIERRFCKGMKPPIVDVFIVLHKGLAKPSSWFGSPELPPYIAKYNKEHNETKIVSDIKEYYIKERGATNVYIQFLDDKDVARTNLLFYDESIEKPDDLNDDRTLLKHLYNEIHYCGFKKSTINLLEFTENNVRSRDKKRIQSYTRWLYMRHRAYMMALEQQKQKHEDHAPYDTFVSQREDTVFYEPIDYEKLEFDYQFANQTNSEGIPYIFVEKFCTWGSYSDKIHIGNQIAMTTLFGSSWEEFIELTRLRLQSGACELLFSSINKVPIPSRTVYQIESFLQHLLTSSSADVHEVNLRRVDSRYVLHEGKTVFCVPYRYYDCQKFIVKKNLERYHNITACPGYKT